MSFLAYKNQILYTPPKDPANEVANFDTLYEVFESPDAYNMEGAGVMNFSLPPAYNNNLIPYMTSNTTPSGTASASSDRNGYHQAFRAMDGVVSDNYAHIGWLPSDADTEPWISYEWGNDQLVALNKIIITTINYNTNYNLVLAEQHRSISIEGLTEQDVWENCLDTGNSVTLDFKVWSFKDFYIDLNGQDYKAIRIKGNDNLSWDNYDTNKTFMCYINNIIVL